MNPATYQREKDGYPDGVGCQECGVFMPDRTLDTKLCDACAWDLYGDEGAEE